jgi:hypothetical protein
MAKIRLDIVHQKIGTIYRILKEQPKIQIVLKPLSAVDVMQIPNFINYCTFFSNFNNSSDNLLVLPIVYTA